MHTQKRIYGQTVIGLDQCFSFLNSNPIVGFKIQCVGHKQIFNRIGYNRKQQRDSHWTFCEIFICYIYMYICVHSCKLYCLPYNRFKKKKKLFENPQTTWYQGDTQILQLNTVKRGGNVQKSWKKLSCYSCHWNGSFWSRVYWRRVPSGLVLLWQSIQIMLSCLAPLKAQLRPLQEYRMT